jgi:hypothetical protein
MHSVDDPAFQCPLQSNKPSFCYLESLNTKVALPHFEVTLADTILISVSVSLNNFIYAFNFAFIEVLE